MRFSFFVAKRYFLAKKKQNFINIISTLSVIGVAIGTMALVVVLSVFNGLEDLIKSIYGSFDPDLKITAVSGKSFFMEDAVYNRIRTLPNVAKLTEIIEDNALVKYGDKQSIVKIKGISGEFSDQFKLKQYIVDGKPLFKDASILYAIVGRGVQYKLGVDIQNSFFQLQFWYPKATKNNSISIENSFNVKNIYPGGIFALERQYDDNYIFMPISFANELLGYDQRRSAIEIELLNENEAEKTKNSISNILGSSYTVKTQDEQHFAMLRAVKIEKLFVYITFSFIMIVSSLNIFFTLTMLAIEKRKDIKIMGSLGANVTDIKLIFMIEGAIIALIGASTGLILGFLICFLQQQFGFISMGAESSIVSSYPVVMKWQDFVLSGLIISVITFLISYQPASKASQFKTSII